MYLLNLLFTNKIKYLFFFICVYVSYFIEIDLFGLGYGLKIFVLSIE